jgi:secreted PhoX family phosphatase
VTAAPRGFQPSQVGPLRAADANGVCLPAGFVSRIVAVSGERPAPRSSYVWHGAPDGGATFATPDGGWVYANNSERRQGDGGVGALRFDARGRVVDAYRVLSGTSLNCAGGATPWGTWLSGEEITRGQVWECQPMQPGQGVARPALGLFKHEAVAVDPIHRTLYLTEDEGDGRFYRFVCSEQDWPAHAARPTLSQGRLQVMRLADVPDNRYPGDAIDVMQPQRVQWVDALEPQAPQSAVRERAGDRAPGTVFKGGEGLWYFHGIVYFSTKGDERIWAYDTARQSLQAIYDFTRTEPALRTLSGVDNLTVSAFGDVLVAEDGGNMELCVIAPDRSVRPLLRVEGQGNSELTGPAFSPDGQRLYVNSQRGSRQGHGDGITYEIRRG